ncbi:phospholipase D-like domain-containing protein [Anaeromusa acidaminophila]|uniref:phospholipase D-like domain-containing protein n=1 Tax=Anaeromusa acidaminophila TaxID=81464 RepID=UPI0003687E76|nr:phospholipase D-like domain-containing protein [Anaeromusa acidaminophila]
MVLSNKVDILDAFEQSWSHVLILTYTHDLVLFERKVLRKLRENGCGNICLFVDSAAHRETFQQCNSIKSIGKDYVVQTVSAGLVFHPKVYLLVNDNECKLLIGSGNLTVPGLFTNKEIFSGHCTSDMDSVFSDYESVNLFLEGLESLTEMREETRLSLALLKKAFKSCLEKLPVFVAKQRAVFLHNIDASIYDQISSLMPDEIQGLTVLSPYFDTDNRIVNYLHKTKGIKEIEIITQERFSNFDAEAFVKLANKLGVKYALKRIEFDGDSRNHAKVLAFHTNVADYIVWGSANFTSAALLKTARTGNAETVMFYKSEKGKWQDLILGEDVILKELNPKQFVFTAISGYTALENQIHLLDATVVEKSLKVTIKNRQEDYVYKILINGKDSFAGVLQTENDNRLVLLIEGFNHAILPAFVQVRGVREDESLLSNVLWLNDTESLDKARSGEAAYNKKALLRNPEFSSRDYILGVLAVIFTELKLDEKDLPPLPQKLQVASQTLYGEDADKDVQYFVDEDESQYEDWTIGVGDYDKSGLFNHYVNAIYAELGIITTNKDMGNSAAQNSNITSIVLTDGDRDFIRERFHAFMRKYLRGIASEIYVSRVKPEVIFLNYKVITNSLSQLVVRRDQAGEPLLEPDIVLREYGELHEKLIKLLLYELKLSDEEKETFTNEILPVMVAEQLANHFAAQDDGEMWEVVQSKKATQCLLQKINKDIIKIKRLIDQQFFSKVAAYSSLFGWDKKRMDAAAIKLINEAFEDISIVELKGRIKTLRKVDTATIDRVDSPRVSILTNAENEHLNWIIVQALYWMVNVEDWAMHTLFTIVIENDNPKRHWSRQVFRYEVNKQLIQRIRYRKGHEMWWINNKIDNGKIKCCYQQIECDVVKNFVEFRDISDESLYREMS